MKAYDFEYDGLCLSDLGYMICKFDSEGLETITNGSQITFNTVPALNGTKHELTDALYESCLEATFQICKNVCTNNDNMEISLDELCELMSWLNRKGFHKFKLLDDDYLDLYFEASFNINKIEISGKVFGLELTMITNKPFAIREPRIVTIKNSVANGTKSIYDTSDDEGYIYPYTEITILKDGDLTITNSLDSNVMSIANCSTDEVITLDYPIIQSSLPSHNIQNDFNWNFFRIGNTFKNKRNDLTISIPCKIKITYSPVAKAGI